MHGVCVQELVRGEDLRGAGDTEARVLARYPDALARAEMGEELVFELARDFFGMRLDQLPAEGTLPVFSVRF